MAPVLAKLTYDKPFGTDSEQTTAIVAFVLGYPVVMLVLILVCDALFWKNALASDAQEVLADLSSWVSKRSSLLMKIVMAAAAVIAALLLILATFFTARVYGATMAAIAGYFFYGIGWVVAKMFGDFEASEVVVVAVLAVSVLWAIGAGMFIAYERADKVMRGYG